LETLIEYFENIPSVYRTGLFMGGLLFFWIIEGVVPLYKLKYKKVKHGALNLFFTTVFLLIGLGSAWLILQVSEYSINNNYGLLQLITLPVIWQVIMGILLLDLIGAYFIHWLEHQIKWMWKFHLIHHSDTNVDVTTGLRHHPGEAIFRIGFTTLAVFITGAPMGTIMIYQTLSVIFAQLTHANIHSPKKLDKILSYLFVTPGMHKVHHHYTQPLTDTNYGNIFSIWDRLLGTYKYHDPSLLKYGIDTHMEPDQNERISKLLSIPFQKYRTPPGTKFGK